MNDEPALREQIAKPTDQIENLGGYIDELSGILSHHRDPVERLSMATERLADAMEERG